MNFKKSQRAEIAEIIRSRDLEPREFDLQEKDIDNNPDNPALILKHKSTEAMYAVYVTNDHFGVLYAPSAVSLKPVHKTGISWSSAMQYLNSWIKYVKEESEADDPWDEQTREDFDDFHNDESNFTPEELQRLDLAIEGSFQHLIAVAEDQGHKVSKEELSQIANDIKFLKDEARKSSKRKWLDAFMGVVLSKLIDWGLSSALVGTVFAKLVEMSHEVMKLSTFVPPHIGN